jgi:probable HAF family extracellular repeat protein
MVGLGDLPGGVFESTATAVSADGSVIVGTGASASGNQAFRWTGGGGMQGLGALPGGVFLSGAYGVSADVLVCLVKQGSRLGPGRAVVDAGFCCGLLHIVPARRLAGPVR